jgi:hypothetical protein
MNARHAVTVAVLLVIAGLAGAAPLSLDAPVRFTGQRFEWRQEYSRRWEGNYGQVEVALNASTAYEFFTADAVGGTSSDPFLYVLDGAGQTVLARNDDGGEGRNARIVFTPPADSVYVVRLRAYRRGRYGTCSVTLRARDDATDPSGVREIGPGDVLTAQTFEWQSAYSSRSFGTYGQYRVRMNANTLYRFETSGASGAGADTVLYLLDDRLRAVWSDDDSGAGYQSKLLFRPAADGTYHLRLRAYDRGARGTCTLSLTTGARAGETPLLPDLHTWRAYLEDTYIAREDGVRVLRFSNAVANRGDGPLQVFGAVDAEGATRAFQVVHNSDGSRTAHPVGTFSFAGHEDHNHWHYDDFSFYRLVSPSTGASVGTSGKVSFCLMDSAIYDEESVPGTPSSARYSCANQGISVGWADVYGAYLDGQEIDLTGVADGFYDLVSTTNPDGRLHEARTSDNEARIRIEIRGTSVRVVP